MEWLRWGPGSAFVVWGLLLVARSADTDDLCMTWLDVTCGGAGPAGQKTISGCDATSSSSSACTAGGLKDLLVPCTGVSPPGSVVLLNES